MEKATLKRVQVDRDGNGMESGGYRREESSYRPGIMQTTQQLDCGLPPVI